MPCFHLNRAVAAVSLGLGLYLAMAAPLANAAATAPTTPDPKAVDQQKPSGMVDKSGTETSVPGKEYVLTPKTSDSMLQPLIGRFASVLVGISGSVALLVFVWAGITMMTADGDTKKIDLAKRMMTWTAIGLFVIFTSAALVRFILGALMTGTAS